MSDLATALLDVRRATRLLHAYQRRVNDLFALISDELDKNGVSFTGWYVLGHNLPPKRSTVFYADRWAWDMMPTHALAAQFAGCNAAGGPIRVHVQIIADTGFEEFEGAGEPDAARFPPAEMCISELRWSVVQGSRPGMSLDGVWDALAAAYGDALYDGSVHRVDCEGGQVAHWYGSIPLASLPDPDAVRVNVSANLIEAIRSS